jgi:membrane associated rhomboid family serine protease
MTYDGPRFALPGLTPAIKLLLLANVAVFVANMVLVGRLSDPAGGEGGFWFAFSWSGLFDGYGLGLLRAVSYQFTHSFRDPMHLLMNGLVLWFFGTLAEQRLGYRGTIKLYLVGGVAGALLHLGIAALQGAANVPLVGASGACYGFLLYAACVAPRSNVILVVFPVPLWGLAALLVGIGLYSTFVEFATGFPGGVSHGAHLGGAVLGFVAHRAGWFVDHSPRDAEMGLLASLQQRWRERQRAATEQASADRELKLDEILAKVKATGLPSLTAAERRFLERQSAAAKGRR